MSVPRATMRLQFHRGFTFTHAAALAPYIASLGISHIYASPIMTARSGSLHGYDTIDPTRVNAELGGEDGLRALVCELRRHDLGLIVDIVPNHMAIGNGNAWWLDVLARGRNSRYGKYFDIDWTPADPHLHGKLLLPILGRPYGEALSAGEIKLGTSEAGQSVIRYFDHEFPVAPDCADVGPGSLHEFAADSAAGRARLHGLLEQQNYRLAWWRCANDEINWRRFFDINELAAIRIEDPEVFEAMHGTLFRLYVEGIIDGVRVDHVDGLSLPETYCRQLRARLTVLERQRPPDCPSGPAYFVVEKILAYDEQLPANWETDGSTGYDFMDEISALQHDGTGEEPLGKLWQQISGRSSSFAAKQREARREILQRSFSSQLEAVLDALSAIAQGDPRTRDISRAALRRTVTEVLAHFPAYRIYAQVGKNSRSDAAMLAKAVSGAATSCLPSDRWLVALLGHWLLGERIRPNADQPQSIALTRFQQLSAPLSAKAVEDTAFYRYGRLLSRNDVGFDPGRFACSTAEFHNRMQLRKDTFPHAMLATATHDHKRGEDVRARLAVLSEIADEWSNFLERWLALSAEQFPSQTGQPLPDAVDRTTLFQTLVGAWPAQPTLDDVGLNRFAERITAWQLKSLREAKLRSEWTTANEPYERAAGEFVSWLFAASPLLPEIAAFAHRIAPAGAVNSLGQTLCKLTAPGVPDIYQGTEYWDLSLVDPDNRQPVDFAARQQLLTASAGARATDIETGRIKQRLIGRVLAARKKAPALFADGDYLPLQPAGPLARHLVAFARVLRGAVAVSVFCRHPARLLGSESSITIAPERWQDTRIVLPAAIRAAQFIDVVSGEPKSASGTAFDAAHILAYMPVTLLLNYGD
ncbi:MAG: malto-oligosyltrehalose synthase [Xanthobacteraceae bacterium]